MARGATDEIAPEFVALAHALADAAGAIARRYFRQKIAVVDKPDLTPVTIADREAETAMRELIAARCPGHGIIGEEHGRTRDDAEFVWVLDPIDGTKNFISGIPLFGTLIGLARAGAAGAGHHRPAGAARALGRRRRRGFDAERRGHPHAAMRGAGPGDALFDLARHVPGEDAARFARLKDKVKLARYGADCYAYAQLASGFIDLVVERDLKPYDFCALVPVIEGAGGAIVDWDGKRARPRQRRQGHRRRRPAARGAGARSAHGLRSPVRRQSDPRRASRCSTPPPQGIRCCGPSSSDAGLQNDRGPSSFGSRCSRICHRLCRGHALPMSPGRSSPSPCRGTLRSTARRPMSAAGMVCRAGAAPSSADTEGMIDAALIAMNENSRDLLRRARQDPRHARRRSRGPVLADVAVHRWRAATGGRMVPCGSITVEPAVFTNGRSSHVRRRPPQKLRRAGAIGKPRTAIRCHAR